MANEVAIGQILDARGPGDPAELLLALPLAQLAALHRSEDGRLDPAPATFDEIGAGLDVEHVEAGPRTHLDDARTHDAAPHHPDLPHVLSLHRRPPARRGPSVLGGPLTAG